jgi:hypothetical protein
MRPTIAAILESLLKRQEQVLSLDAVGEAVGTEPIAPGEVEELFQALENAGRQIGAVTPNVRQHLALVLREARRLRLKQHSTPDIVAIAAATGLAAGEVRAALFYASVLGR